MFFQCDVYVEHFSNLSNKQLVTKVSLSCLQIYRLWDVMYRLRAHYIHFNCSYVILKCSSVQFSFEISTLVSNHTFPDTVVFWVLQVLNSQNDRYGCDHIIALSTPPVMLNG